MTTGDRYFPTCELSSGGQAILHVFHWQTGKFVDLCPIWYKGIARLGIWVAPTDEISMGKKPRDTTNGDTYAGDIDNIKITRWEPVTS